MEDTIQVTFPQLYAGVLVIWGGQGKLSSTILSVLDFRTD